MRAIILTVAILFEIIDNSIHITSAQPAPNVDAMVRTAMENVNRRQAASGSGTTSSQTVPQSVRQLNLFNRLNPRVAAISDAATRTLSVMEDLDAASTAPVARRTVAQRTAFVMSDPVDRALKRVLPCLPKPRIICNATAKFRTADASCNNLKNPEFGKSFIAHERWLDPEYDDGFNSPRTRSVNGGLLPSTRLISNVLSDIDVHPFDNKLTMMTMAWGQFVDHDVTSTPTTSTDPNGNPILCCGKRIQPPQCFRIDIPNNDPFFTRQRCFEFTRSTPILRDPCTVGKREQINQLTSILDASNVYGSDEEQMAALREPGISGKLKVSPVDLPPPDSPDACILPTPTNGAFCMKGGDSRLNEVTHLGGMHVAFLRLHNLVATKLGRINRHWEGERIFQESRRIVAALQQIVSYKEYLPIILNRRDQRKYCLHSGCRERYNPSINPTTRNAFVTAILRFGHTQVPRTEAFLDENFRITEEVPLERTFNNPHMVTANRGANVDDLMRFVCTTRASKTDRFPVPELRNKLFQDNETSFDLFALNMQRGRDHGLPSYNKWRTFCGLAKAKSFSNLPDHSKKVAKLFSSVYSHVDDIDLFAGGISENPVRGGLLGPTFSCLLAKQFRNFKLGDRFFWTSNDRVVGFTRAQKRALEKVRLSWIMCRVFNLPKIQRNIFKQVGKGNRLQRCGGPIIRSLNLRSWREITNPYS